MGFLLSQDIPLVAQLISNALVVLLENLPQLALWSQVDYLLNFVIRQQLRLLSLGHANESF